MDDNKPPYYVIKNGIGLCAPSLKMRRNNFAGLKCGVDGPEARARAREWYKRWIERNRELKIPSSNAEYRGHIVFLRTATHVFIAYMTERNGSIIVPRLSSGETFESIVIVRGNRADESYLLRRLEASKIAIGFSLSDEVLLEMRSAARAQRVVRSAEDEDERKIVKVPTPERLINSTGKYSTDVTDEQWHAISTILRRKTPNNQRPRPPDRRTIDAIIHHLRSGQPWTKLPKEMPYHAKVRTMYASLVERGKWELIENVISSTTSSTKI